ncbi:MAG TPA: hypothetical protein VFK80_00240, partial [Limnochordia bacterium]|nr:hypothetical protein [Limnochordia bacterium]
PARLSASPSEGEAMGARAATYVFVAPSQVILVGGTIQIQYDLQPLALTGVDVSYQQVAGVDGNPDAFLAPTDALALLRVRNASAADITVTIEAASPCLQGVLHDVLVTVPAGEEREIGPFDRSHYADEWGLVEVHYSSADSVTAAVVSLRPT